MTDTPEAEPGPDDAERAEPGPDDAERAELLAEVRTLRTRRDELQAELDAIDGRRWDVFTRLRGMEPTTPHWLIAEAWGTSVPAIIQALGKPRPVPAAERAAQHAARQAAKREAARAGQQ